MEKFTFYLTKDSKGLEKRLYKSLVERDYVLSLTRGTWCELFNTKGHKRLVKLSVRHLERYRRNIVRLLESLNNGTLPNDYKYDCEFVGSNRLGDVREKRDQKWILQIEIKS
jgi:hypothetical protein